MMAKQEHTTTKQGFDIVRAITDKRDNRQLSCAQIEAFVDGYSRGSIPDYQASALLMAIVWRGMTEKETLCLTQAMVASGEQLDPGGMLGRRIVDKHSTGGVGDKTSIGLAPLVAACGVPVGKMSGRGLGHTGGTLDKLESFPGFNIELDQHRFTRQVQEIGIAIAGQTANLVPADKQLYALRDVTGTVESIPLIAASIMSKKLASGADAIVLDVKVGSGAFMKNIDDARTLADEMIAIGEGAGRDVKVLITQMDYPLGRAIGNSHEVDEVRAFLDGNGPSDLRELTLTAASILLSLSDLGVDEQEALNLAVETLDSGKARTKFDEWIRAQGGDPFFVFPSAPIRQTVTAPHSGTITRADALGLGLAAVSLGAGRKAKGDAIDHTVGIVLSCSVGDKVEQGDSLVEIYARDQTSADVAADAVLHCFEIDQRFPQITTPVILERRG